MGSLLNTIAQGYDPQKVQGEALQNQQRQAELANAPIIQQQQQEALRSEQLKNAQTQQTLGDTATVRRNLQAVAQDPSIAPADRLSKALDLSSGQINPNYEMSQRTALAGLNDKVADYQQKMSVAADNQQKAADIQKQHIADMAADIEAHGNDLSYAHGAVLANEAHEPDPKNRQAYDALLTSFTTPEAVQQFTSHALGNLGPAGQEARAKAQKAVTDAQAAQQDLTTKRRGEAISEIQGVTDQPTLDAFLQKYPEMKQQTGRLYNPGAIQFIQRQAVPVKDQPEFDIKNLQLKAAQSSNPTQDKALLDNIIDPKANPELNKMTWGRIVAARSQPDPEVNKTIGGILKDAADQIGRTRTAVATEQAKAPIELSIAERNRQQQQLFQSYSQNNGELDKLGGPVEQTASKIGDLKALMAEASPQAWANVPAKLLTLTAGGQGSGLRMSTPLLDAELGGAGKWAQLQGSLQQWALDPDKASKISDAQKKQIQNVVNAMDSHVQQKQSVVDQARKDLIAAPDVTTHRKIVLGAHQGLSAIDAGKQAGASTAVATPKNRAEYDALPNGAHYMKNGTEMIKQ